MLSAMDLARGRLDLPEKIFTVLGFKRNGDCGKRLRPYLPTPPARGEQKNDMTEKNRPKLKPPANPDSPHHQQFVARGSLRTPFCTLDICFRGWP